MEERTLEQMQEVLKQFMEMANGDLKKAKNYFNVIHEPLIDIPINQVVTLPFKSVT